MTFYFGSAGWSSVLCPPSTYMVPRHHGCNLSALQLSENREPQIVINESRCLEPTRSRCGCWSGCLHPLAVRGRNRCQGRVYMGAIERSSGGSICPASGLRLNSWTDRRGDGQGSARREEARRRQGSVNEQGFCRRGSKEALFEKWQDARSPGWVGICDMGANLRR